MPFLGMIDCARNVTRTCAAIRTDTAAKYVLLLRSLTHSMSILCYCFATLHLKSSEHRTIEAGKHCAASIFESRHQGHTTTYAALCVAMHPGSNRGHRSILGVLHMHDRTCFCVGYLQFVQTGSDCLLDGKLLPHVPWIGRGPPLLHGCRHYHPAHTWVFEENHGCGNSGGGAGMNRACREAREAMSRRTCP